MTRRGSTLIDVAGGVVITSVLLALVIAVLGESRRHARLDEDIASLKQYAVGTSAYAADHAGLLWGYSWGANETHLVMNLEGELVPTEMPGNDLGASGVQAVHLLRSHAGRIGEGGIPDIEFWGPPIWFSHLPLLEYLGESFLAEWTVSAADDVRRHWRDDPENKFDQGFWLPLQPDPTPRNRVWAYRSSFDVIPAAWDYGQSEPGDEWTGRRTQQGGSHDTVSVPGDVQVGGRVLGDVSYPSQKVHVYDTHQRHFGAKEHFFGVFNGADGVSPARVTMAMFDGSAGVRAADDSNPGWRPNTPTVPCMTYWYRPRAWEPATTNGEDLQFSIGFFRWTRVGLKGLDFGGLPLDTGQPERGVCDL